MSIEHTGVFRGAYATAYHALLQRGRMIAGEWVLVHGAAGGIGIAAMQVAKLFGDVGIAADRLPELARQYDGSGPIATNPRLVRGADDLVEILKLAL